MQITQGRSEAKALLKEYWKDMEQAIHDAGMHLEDEGDVTVYTLGLGHRRDLRPAPQGRPHQG